MPNLTATRTEWADVTLAEFAALKLAASPDAVQRVQTYWEHLYATGKTPFATEPTRLTERGAEWLSSLAPRVLFTYRHTDATDARKLAREIIHVLGTLTVLNA